jgi:hypothetical protein
MSIASVAALTSPSTNDLHHVDPLTLLILAIVGAVAVLLVIVVYRMLRDPDAELKRSIERTERYDRLTNERWEDRQ